MKRLLLLFCISIFSFPNLQAQVPQQERDALISFYDATNGDNWNDNTNWNSANPVASWFGITVEKINGVDHVTRIIQYQNNLSGIIIPEIDNFTELVYLDLGDNNLTGTIPSEIGNLTNLDQLKLNTNQLTGEIPISFSNLTKLTNLNLTLNQFSGGIPPEFGNLINLYVLHLGNSGISGTIPAELGNLSRLWYLDLSGCALTGGIPNELGNLTNLSYLYLFQNALSGSLPSSFQNLTALIQLLLSNNNLSGDIPNLTGLQNLSVFNISNNNFQFGDFEDEFQTYQNNISQFNYVPQQNQHENHILDQTINVGEDITLTSASVSGNYTYYQWFFGSNAISGANSTELKLENIQLADMGVYSCYAFNSIIPNLTPRTGISTLNRTPGLHPEYNDLVAFYNATNGDNWVNNTNWLSDEPIHTWYGVGTLYGDGNSLVTSLYLNNNNLRGELPEEIGNFSNLFNLGLSQNNLTGNIPQSITNLSKLAGIELQYNNLSGEIPDLSANETFYYFYLHGNKFQFSDFENSYTDYKNKIGSSFLINPQQLVGEPEAHVVDIGESISFSVPSSLGSNISANWYKKDDLGNYTYVTSGLSANITINTESDYGDYIYYAGSNIVTDLFLESHRITLGIKPSSSADYDALVALYNSTNGDNWRNNTNWLDNTKPLSSWHGLYLENNRVVNLYLGSNNLTGTIPSEIKDLTELTYLDLFINDLTGEIPLEIWNLTKMKTMYLGAQQSGDLLLSNGIPDEISNLQELEWLNLTRIPLTQPLQPELFNLPKLIRLRVESCGLTGTLPQEFSNILDVLASGNEFEGEIPESIVTSTINQRLNIARNYFDFSDLEPLVTFNTRDYFNYSPQRTKDVEQNIASKPGSDITLTIADDRHNKTRNYIKGEGDIYQWFKDDIAITGANANTYTISNVNESDSGNYYCEITNSLVPDLKLVRANITLLVDATLSNNNVNETDNFQVFPNPTKNTLNIKLNNKRAEQATLFDMTGKQVLTIKSLTETTIMDIRNLQSGVYILQIKSQNKISTKRIIKE